MIVFSTYGQRRKIRNCKFGDKVHKVLESEKCKLFESEGNIDSIYVLRYHEGINEDKYLAIEYLFKKNKLRAVRICHFHNNDKETLELALKEYNNYIIEWYFWGASTTGFIRDSSLLDKYPMAFGKYAKDIALEEHLIDEETVKDDSLYFFQISNTLYLFSFRVKFIPLLVINNDHYYSDRDDEYFFTEIYFKFPRIKYEIFYNTLLKGLLSSL